MSSIFLEPVSLGNYCTIMGAYFATRYRELNKAALLIGFAALTFLVTGCDGRLATASIVIIIGICFLASHLPPFTATLYLPLVLIAAVGVGLLMHSNPLSDDLPGRVAYSLDILSQFKLMDWLGMPSEFLK